MKTSSTCVLLSRILIEKDSIVFEPCLDCGIEDFSTHAHTVTGRYYIHTAALIDILILKISMCNLFICFVQTIHDNIGVETWHENWSVLPTQ